MNEIQDNINNRRLIDANELKKHQVEVYQGNGVELETIMMVPVKAIDNAETYNQVGHKMATAEGFCTNPEWNKGEWIITNETDEFYGGVYKCTHCGKDMLACGCRNFCTWCGADMRRKEKEK